MDIPFLCRLTIYLCVQMLLVCPLLYLFAYTTCLGMCKKAESQVRSKDLYLEFLEYQKQIDVEERKNNAGE